MACKKRGNQVPLTQHRREQIQRLFAAGEAKKAAFLRLGQCVSASQPGRLCEQLVKGPGISSVYCVDVQAGKKTELYPALEDAGFQCPLGRF